MKLYNCYYISSSSIKEDKALSAYMTEFSSFNVIDVDLLTDVEDGVDVVDVVVEEKEENRIISSV
jgi:ActR/RegA family two-component response regulator